MAAVSITVANVLATTTTQTLSGTAGATITAGQPLYKDATDSNKLKLCDADASAAAANCVGVSMHGALSGQPIQYAISGPVTIGGTVAVGTIYIVGATAGAINPVTDAVSGWYVTILGPAISATQLSLILVASGVAVP